MGPWALSICVGFMGIGVPLMHMQLEGAFLLPEMSINNNRRDLIMRIIDVVQWDTMPGIFAWRYPENELNTKTQLIVREDQEAVLFNSGQAFGPFGPGRHVLNTSNYPVLTSLVKTVTGGRSPFSAEVWFVSKAFKLDIKWGTGTPIQVEDPKYHIMLPVRAFGQYGLVVKDTSKFLIKMMGMVPTFSEQVLANYFKGIVLTVSKSMIAKYLVENGISILQMSVYLQEISDGIEARVLNELEDYGMSLVNFTVNSISTDEENPAVIQLRNALSKKAEMDIIGYTYKEERSFDTVEAAAANEGSGNIMNVGTGLGMGVALGGHVGNMMNNLADNISVSSNSKTCPACNKSIDGNSMFCPHCGKSTTKDDNTECSKCGNKMNADCKFCPSCGAPNAKLSSTKCPVCNAVVTKEMKFCGSCGTVLVKKCPNCNSEVGDGSKFCNECGTQIK